VLAVAGIPIFWTTSAYHYTVICVVFDIASDVRT